MPLARTSILPEYNLALLTGLPEPVWAAALAANWDRKVKDLVDDIYGDHNYMVCCLTSHTAVDLPLHPHFMKFNHHAFF